MNRIFLFSVLVVLALAMGMGAVQAQENTTDNATDAIENATSSEEENETIAEADEDYEQIVDEHVTLTHWEYRDGELILEFDATMSTGVDVFPAIDRSQGVGQATYTSEMVPRGGGTIAVDAKPINGEINADIFTHRTRQEGRYVWVSTGHIQQETPFERTSSTAGWFGGSIVSIVMIGFAARRTKNKQYEPVKDTE